MWKTNWIGLVALGAALPASAQWQLIDDFQQWELTESEHFLTFDDAEQIGWHAYSEDQTDEYWMLQDPGDPENIGMYVEPGNNGVSYGTTFVMKALPGVGIQPGDTGTLFFRCLWDGPDNMWHMGTADKPLAYDDQTGLQTAPGAYRDLNALIRISRFTVLEHRDGDAYVSTDPPVVPIIGVWYSFWMVVENTWDMSTMPPTCTGIHTLYVQGEGIGDGVSPTLIPIGTDPPKDSAFLRRPPADDEGNPRAIIWAVFVTANIVGSPSAGDPYHLDDFYFSKGENLSDPTDTVWIDIPIDPNGVVDTLDFLGWINVTAAPYIFSYSLNGWIYLEEPATDAAGAWAYFYK